MSAIPVMEEDIEKQDQRKSKKKSTKKKETPDLLTPTCQEKEKSTLDVSENEISKISTSHRHKEKKTSASKHSKDEKHSNEASDFPEKKKSASKHLISSGAKEEEAPESLPSPSKEKKKDPKKKKEGTSSSVTSLKFSEGLKNKEADILSPRHKEKTKSATKQSMLPEEQREEVSETSKEKKKHTNVSGKIKKDADLFIEMKALTSKVSENQREGLHDSTFEKEKLTSDVSEKKKKEPSDSPVTSIEKKKSKTKVSEKKKKEDTSIEEKTGEKSSKKISGTGDKETAEAAFKVSGELVKEPLDLLPVTSIEKKKSDAKVSGKKKKEDASIEEKKSSTKISGTGDKETTKADFKASGELVKEPLDLLPVISIEKKKSDTKVSRKKKKEDSFIEEEKKSTKISGTGDKETTEAAFRVFGELLKEPSDSLFHKLEIKSSSKHLITSEELKNDTSSFISKKTSSKNLLVSEELKEEENRPMKIFAKMKKKESYTLLLKSKENEEKKKVSGKLKKVEPDSFPLKSKEEGKKEVSGKLKKDEPDSFPLTSKEKDKKDQKVSGKLKKDEPDSFPITSKEKEKKVKKVSGKLKTESDSSLKSKEKKKSCLKQTEFFDDSDSNQLASQFTTSTHSPHRKQKRSPCASATLSPQTSQSSLSESAFDSKASSSRLGVSPISGSKFYESGSPYSERDKGKAKKGDGSQTADNSEVGIYLSEEALFSSMGMRCRHFRYSIDMRSLQDASLEVGFDYYLRYSYKFFGCPYPVLVQPPVSLLFPGANLSFVRSYSSFDFGVVYKNFVQYVTDNPLTVEVWTVYPDDRDFISGLAQVPLHKVLYEKKINQQDDTIQQMIMVECPIFPPSSNLPTIATTVTGFVPKLATLHITLVLEDMGPIAEKIRPTTYSEEESVWKKKKKISDEMKDIKRVVDLSDHELKRRDHEILDIVKKKYHKDHDKMKMTSQIARSINVRMRAGSAHQEYNGYGAAGGVGGMIELCADSVEYKVAMELDMCRASGDRVFWGKEKKVEAYHMSHLASKWEKKEGDTDTHQRELYMSTKDHSTSLEKNLQDGIQQLQKWRRILKDRQDQMSQEKEQHVEEIKQINDQCEKSRRTAEAKYQQSLDIGRNRSRELQYQVDLLKKQANQLDTKLRSRNNEFEKFQRAVVIPQSKLRGDLTMAQLEKEELEGKLASLSTSKDKYKKKWKETLSELVVCQHQESYAFPTQGSELAEVHMNYRECEGDGSFNLQIGKIKTEVKRMELQVSSPKSPYKSHSPSPCTGSISPSVVTNNNKAMVADVARWIEQRDILLQTGLYLNTDGKIQHLNYKIEAAISKINT